MSNYNKLCEALKNDNEIKIIMKEKFYQLKIQEAKNKKKQNGNNYWDLLPEDLQQNILKEKEYIEYKPKNKTDTTGFYLEDLWFKHKLTYTTFNKWIFDVAAKSGYRFGIPSINQDPSGLWYAIINKKNLFEVVFGKKEAQKSKNIKDQKIWELVTKDYTPSIYDFIKYSNEQKEKTKQKKKEKQDKFYDNDKFKVGDIVWHYGSWQTNVDMGYYLITGTTKTMYRVKKIDHKEIAYCWDPPYNQTRTYLYYIDMDKTKQTYTKYKNIGKKTYLELARQPTEYVSETVIEYCNKRFNLNQMYYETKDFNPN